MPPIAMPATLLCYRCRTFQAEASMRRVSTGSGARWRCLKCLEETGWRPANNLAQERAARQESLVDALLREPNPARREKNFLGRALLFSLLFHASLVSLQLGSSGFGLPWLRASTTLDRTPDAALRAVLQMPPARAEPEPAAAQLTGQRTVRTTAQPGIATPSQLVAARASSAAKLPPAPKKPGNTELPLKKKPSAPAPQKGAEVLATHASSPWQAPLERVAREALEDSTSETGQGNPLFSATESSDADQADPPTAAVIALQEASQGTQAEDGERRRLAVESRQAEQAALTRASQAAAERQQAEEALRIQAEHDAKIRAAVEAENRKVEEEAATAKVRQEAVESHQRETLARVEAEKKHTEQVAAAAKARQEALDKQRAADLERDRQAPAAAGNRAQNAAGKPGEREPHPAVKTLEQPENTPLALPSRAPEPAGPKRKASIVGADPKNISLAFYGEGWRQKIERIGAVNYPRLYKDRDYAPLVVTVTLNSDGTLAGVRIDKSSGQQEMDDAVGRIVEMSAPFAAFPPDLKRSYDQIEISRTWVFEHRPRIKNY